MNGIPLSYPWNISQIRPLLSEARIELSKVVQERPPVVGDILLKERDFPDDTPADVKEAVTFLELKGILQGVQERETASPVYLEVAPAYKKEWGFLKDLQSDLFKSNQKTRGESGEAVFAGSFAVLGDWCDQTLPFVHGLALSWGLAHMGHAGGVEMEANERSIQKLSFLLRGLWETGCAAGLRSVNFEERMHRISVEDVLQANGWLRGHAAQLKSHEPDSLEHEIGEMILHYFNYFVHRFLAHDGIALGLHLAVEELPHQVDRFRQKVNSLLGSANPRDHQVAHAIQRQKHAAFQQGLTSRKWTKLEQVLAMG